MWWSSSDERIDSFFIEIKLKITISWVLTRFKSNAKVNPLNIQFYVIKLVTQNEKPFHNHTMCSFVLYPLPTQNTFIVQRMHRNQDLFLKIITIFYVRRLCTMCRLKMIWAHCLPWIYSEFVEISFYFRFRIHKYPNVIWHAFVVDSFEKCMRT